MLFGLMRSSLTLGVCGLALTGLACTRDNPAFDAPDEVGESVADVGSEGPDTETGSTDSGSTDSGSTDTTSSTDSGSTDTGSSTDSGVTETDTGETDTGEPLCGAPTIYADCDAQNDGVTELPWQAIGLGCEGPEGETIAVTNPEFASVDTAAWRVAKAFGTAAGPNYGDKLWAARPDSIKASDGVTELPPNTSSAILILSTGKLPSPNLDGAVAPLPGTQLAQGANQNPDLGGPPEPINPALGSNNGAGGTPMLNCAPAKDCSDSLHESWVANNYGVFHDKLWMRFTVTPPPDVHGFVFDLAFFSSEYPQYADSPAYADTFVTWASSESFSGNLSFIGAEPLSTYSLAQSGNFAHLGPTPELLGTGFETNAATAWTRVRGPANPGEPVEIVLFLTDLGDATRASVVLLDNFRWDCGGCLPEGCGLEF